MDKYVNKIMHNIQAFNWNEGLVLDLNTVSPKSFIKTNSIPEQLRKNLRIN